MKTTTNKIAVRQIGRTPHFIGALLLAVIFTLGIAGVKGQTTLSGTASNGCTAAAPAANNTNTAIGCSAGNANSGSNNTSVGNLAGNALTGTGAQNTFVGYQAGTANTSGINNTFIGYNAGVTNTTTGASTFVGREAGQAQTTGGENTFLGYQAGFSNTSGIDNVASGNQAFYWNTTGTANCVVGYQAGKGSSGNSYSHNSFFGWSSGNVSTTGTDNSFFGSASGANTTSGNYNTFMGRNAGWTNATGTDNTFIGRGAGYANTASYNTALGRNAGQTITTGSNNTCVGYGADVAAAAIERGAFGYNAMNNHADYSIQLGSTAVTDIWCGNGTATVHSSDGRFKFNIKEEVKGLEFINKLRPVTYQMDTKKLDDFVIKDMPDSIKQIHQSGMNFQPSTSMIHSGFIAQEVEKAAKSCGFTCSIVRTPLDSTKGQYGLAYGEIVVPLVKAVQELSHKVDSLVNTKSSQRSNNSGGDKGSGNSETTINIQLANNCVLYQNQPNPTSSNTTIRYFIPENVTGAYIVFFDFYGKEIKRVEIKETGNGKIEADTQNLMEGMYSYSLIVNGKVIDTKKMEKN
ncbi:MAG: tail fiber domain-containing protein [Bacteroidetes bacterium]|nr:tail fiber domain-containing protein [Bacteroidota bacterium]